MLIPQIMFRNAQLHADINSTDRGY